MQAWKWACHLPQNADLQWSPCLIFLWCPFCKKKEWNSNKCSILYEDRPYIRPASANNHFSCTNACLNPVSMFCYDFSCKNYKIPLYYRYRTSDWLAFHPERNPMMSKLTLWGSFQRSYGWASIQSWWNSERRYAGQSIRSATSAI